MNYSVGFGRNSLTESPITVQLSFELLINCVNKIVVLKQEEEQFNFLFELLVNQLIKNYLFIINNKLLMNK